MGRFLAVIAAAAFFLSSPALFAASSAGSELRRFQDEEIQRSMLERVEEDRMTDEELITYRGPDGPESRSPMEKTESSAQ